ncbi:MAG TPA: hypothetical protein VMV92_21065 [Streptosporangiaceae bacterium]|nr:hypothetical protein [Streptosporangiaceae bacterium]
MELNADQSEQESQVGRIAGAAQAILHAGAVVRRSTAALHFVIGGLALDAGIALVS